MFGPLPTSSILAARLAQRTLELCQIPSPTGEEAAIADYVEQWARSRFPPEEVVRRSCSLVVGRLEDPRPTVALVGHLDTVPPHPGAGPARIEGDRLFGRGSSDMKSGLSVMMTLAEELDGATLPYNVVLIFYEREEGPFRESGLGLLMDALPLLRNIRLGIVLEPSDNVVQVGCLGSLHATLRFRGRSAHSARPWQGENAVHQAGPLLSELLVRPPHEVRLGGYSFREVFTVTLASGGRTRNIVPDLMELNLNYRFAPGKSLSTAQEELLALVAGRAEVEFVDLSPSGRVCAGNPLFERLLSVTGLPATSKQAWTDVARFSELGVDAINFGPGESAQAHQANESTPVGALEVAFVKLRAFLGA